jgi:hypothetical protein
MEIGRLQDDGKTLTTYSTLVLAKWPASVPTIAFTILAIVDSARSQQHQLVLPPLDWLLVAMACAMVAQLLVWRDLWVEPVEAVHIPV